MNLFVWQSIYILAAVLLLPFLPFLYLQGQYARRKIGLLPDAAGETTGKTGTGGPEVNFLAIGESTIAGLGAATHETALTGQFAMRLSAKIGRRVCWRAIGKNGYTSRRTLEELVPLIPEGEKYDYILLATCGNEVLKLNSPWKFRRWTRALIEHFRSSYPGASIFITNAPAIRLSPGLPQPIRFILGWLSQIHEANIKEFTAGMDKVFYFHQPQQVGEDFFSDGIHPSEKGYSDWSEAMIRFFIEHYGW